MRIAELEKRTGVSRHTLRYYEKEGLLQEVGRCSNNYRDYPELAVSRVGMVRQLKDLGFSLSEIREVMSALRGNRMDCAQGALLMAEKRADVERRINELQAVSQLLAVEQERLEVSARASCGGPSGVN
ncbi:MerR family transcriptional regulator [Marinobacter zhejiangensis]|uniref:DNA-binding transcriptional regulator, MerR family n=1 Tax=Marinobacter zhejiangensis TaxID=488535 RepID=A0A1I4Q794_9GAMM|nr:MerR family transcriptional regulator [Marinobacter zhejiangensis]SFM35676.1 DNA-binding transcriptional regulator, MerR family [Marinobacter zhejiangensis]